MAGVYLHVPYCRTICPYCDFSRVRLAGNVPSRFIDALCVEIEAFEGFDAAETVFLGGGTPSLLAPQALERVLETLRARFTFLAPEVSIEANPDDVTPDLADAWIELGINRVSLGVQSFDDAVLRFLGRRHDAAAAERACRIVAARFENWSLDLIFGAHPIETWTDTLHTCRELAPAHVSAYGLTYETGTPFEARQDRAIDDETWLRLYRETDAGLDAYERYEISNFARPGFACRHNLIYWHNEEYAGFGPAAYAFVGGTRSRNTASTEAYLAAPGTKEEALELSGDEIRLETVIQHLRLAAGLPKGYYRGRFGRDVEVDFGDALRQLSGIGLVEDTGAAIRPTARGFELNNEIGLALIR